MDADVFNLQSYPPAVPVEDAGPSLKESWSYRRRIPLSAVSLLASLALALWQGPAQWNDPRATLALWLAGWGLLLGGVLLRLWATMCLGGRKSREVIDVGPYSLCRNPLYVGTLMLAVAQVGFYQNAWILVGLIGPILLYVYGVVPSEERKLLEKLGAPYANYCQRTPRWMPRFSGFASARLIESTASRSFRLELARCAIWLALPALAHLLTTVSAAWR